MEYNLKSILNLNNEDNLSIRNCLDMFFEYAKNNIDVLVNQLIQSNSYAKIYVLPNANFELANNLKLLTISSYLLIYELTKSPIILVQADIIVKNEKICTPDVFFFSLTIIDELLKKKLINDYDEIIEYIFNKINQIQTLNPEYFDVDLREYQNYQTSQRSLTNIDKNVLMIFNNKNNDK